MALHLQQLQKQTQRLIMTPQMQQSIQLLQLNSMELEQLADQELTENPFLTVEEQGEEEPREEQTESRQDSENGQQPEQDAFDQVREGIEERMLSGENGQVAAPPAPESSLSNEQPQTEQPQPPSAADAAGTTTPEEGENPDAPSLEKVPEQFEQVDLNWDEYYSDSENSTYSGNREDIEERDFAEYVAAKTSLADQLHWQLRCSTLEDLDARICEYLIGDLNDDGYLAPEATAEAAAEFGIEIEQVERVLAILQEFDPPGIGARSLAESLLIQMKNLGSYSDLARKILENHLTVFQKKKFRELGRKLGVSEEELIDLHHKVSRLEPHPGRSLSVESVQYITPDVFVKLIDGELMIYLNEGRIGKLSVDRFYQRMLHQQRRALTQKDREYAVEKFRSALTLIKNIEKRKSTILRVTEAIMDVQRPFLESGVERLKPLTLREVADMVGMHESTVARVTSSKYVETPQGNYELKYFFSSSIDSAGSDAVSSWAIKEKLQQIIHDEDPAKPHSDQKIAEMLKERSFEIARRTVTKYREQLKILPAKYRRQT